MNSMSTNTALFWVFTGILLFAISVGLYARFGWARPPRRRKHA